MPPGDPSPTIVALEINSAWIVILAVTLITLPVTLLLRRLIARPGGLASGVLMLIPLALPLVAAVAYAQAVLPEVTVLKPAAMALMEKPEELLHLLWLSDGRGATPYAFVGSAGPWLLLFGLVVSSIALIRRLVGTISMRRLIGRCARPSPAERHVEDMVVALAAMAGMPRPPELLLLPDGVTGAFATGGGVGRILLSRELIERLEPEELRGIVAHELAHIEARDTSLMFAGGLLRDMTAWNPLAHIAYRRISTDREREADRRAACLTQDPLSLASGLLCVRELMKAGPTSYRTAVAALKPKGRIARRVSNLIALADGGVGTPVGRLPYLFAALAVALVGLGAGAQIAQQEGAFAIVWGQPDAAEATVWRAAPRVDQADKDARAKPIKGYHRRARYLPMDGGILIVKQRDIPKWLHEMARLASRLGVPASTFQWEKRPAWQALPLLTSRPLPGGVGLYRVEPLARYTPSRLP